MAEAADRPLDTQLASLFDSVPDMWRHRVASTPDTDAFITRHGAYWRETTWQSADRRVTKIANALLYHGLKPEDRCIIFAETSLQWILVDLGILCSGGATTSVFPASTDADCEFIIRDCESAILFCGSALQAERVFALKQNLSTLQLIVCFEAIEAPNDEWLTLDQFEALGSKFSKENPDVYNEATQSIRPDHLATLMYTSGTTGEPKGVMLTHASWVYVAESIDAMEIFSPVDSHYLFLPLSHVFAKVLQVILLRLGLPTVIDSDTDRLLTNLAETRPTLMGAVPRIFESVHQKIHEEARQAGGPKYKTFKWAIQIGLEVSRLKQQKLRIGRRLRIKWQLADRLVFRKIRMLFGGKIRFFISGGAPLSKEIAEFFHACDLLILEGYGLTESAAASTFNSPENYRFGTVGLPIPGSEIKLADDGEILLRSRAIMTGYYKRPQDTKDTLTEDGWLKTGDIGIIHPSGHVQITDRKKEIIVTSRGKNIAPSNFENRLKGLSRFVSQAVVHGDRRPYCTAILAIDKSAIEAWATEQEIRFVDYDDLINKPQVAELVSADIDRVNRQLPPYEQVRQFLLMTEEPTVENGLLTPTLKVKRSVVEKQHNKALNKIYREKFR